MNLFERNCCMKQVCRGQILNKASSLFTSNDGQPLRNHLNQLHLFQLFKDRLKKIYPQFHRQSLASEKNEKNCMQKNLLMKTVLHLFAGFCFRFECTREEKKRTIKTVTCTFPPAFASNENQFQHNIKINANKCSSV